MNHYLSQKLKFNKNYKISTLFFIYNELQKDLRIKSYRESL